MSSAAEIGQGAIEQIDAKVKQAAVEGDGRVLGIELIASVRSSIPLAVLPMRCRASRD